MSKMYDVDSINEDVTGELQPEGEYGIIEQKEEAMTLLERIKARQAAITDLEKLYEMRTRLLRDKIEIADKWLADEKEKLQRQIDFFKTPLEHFMRAINASNPKIKSLKLPTGTLKLRKLPDTVTLKDNWKAGEADVGKPGINKIEKVEIKVSLSEIKKHIQETGEELDYAELVPGETKFEVEVI